MAQLYRSIVTWRGPTVEEREAGAGWLMLTWPNLVLPVLKDCNKCCTVDFLTVIDCQLDQAVCHQVCGRVAGYQYYAPDAFQSSCACIDGAFFDGLSIMYGSPHKHIWTYAAGYTDHSFAISSIFCPCNNGSTFPAPSFIGNDCYCESGSNIAACNIPSKLYSNDVLWDGQQCDGTEGPYCTHPNMPWFIKTLNERTTEDIELRACTQHFGCYGSVPIFLIEIYVH